MLCKEVAENITKDLSTIGGGFTGRFTSESIFALQIACEKYITDFFTMR
jgi:hypothetical protein